MTELGVSESAPSILRAVASAAKMLKEIPVSAIMQISVSGTGAVGTKEVGAEEGCCVPTVPVSVPSGRR